MSELALGILGFLIIICIIAILMKSWTVPAMAFSVVPFVALMILVITGMTDLEGAAGFVSSGVKSTSSTACLFVFSILFFGIMTDAGMFDKIINALVKKVGDSILGITIMTCVIAMIGHLDGGGASTFLITIPAMLPIYKKMHMRPTSLLTICVSAMGVMNLMPWGGPTLRAASVLNVEANALWGQIIPMQVVGIILAFGTAVLIAMIEKKRGAGLNGKLAQEAPIVETQEELKQENELARPHLFLVNIALTVFVIFCLIKFDDFPSYFPFMVGSAVALFINYPGSKMQGKIIKSHAGPAITMASTIFAAGVLLGVLGGEFASPVNASETTTLMNCMADIIVNFIPTSLGAHLPLLLGILAVPLTLCFDTDSFFYGLLPVMIGVGEGFGVNPMHIAVVMVVCRNCATFISPCVPATFLGCGLADVEIQDHIKSSFLWIWAFSLLCLLAGFILGVIKI